MWDSSRTAYVNNILLCEICLCESLVRGKVKVSFLTTQSPILAAFFIWSKKYGGLLSRIPGAVPVTCCYAGLLSPQFLLQIASLMRIFSNSCPLEWSPGMSVLGHIGPGLPWPLGPWRRTWLRSLRLTILLGKTISSFNCHSQVGPRCFPVKASWLFWVSQNHHMPHYFLLLISQRLK